MVDMCECTHRSFSPGHHFSFVQWLGHGIVVVFQLLNHVWLFVTPWTAARQASLSFTISQSSLKLMSIETMMPSNHLILCHSLLLLASIFPSIKVFSNESVLLIKWPKYWPASVLPISIQDWFPWGWTGLISLQSKGFSRAFSSTIIGKQQFFGSHPSLWSNSHIHTWPLEKPKLWLDGPLLVN